MPRRNPHRAIGKRNQRGSSGDGTLDLFKEKMVAAMNAAVAGGGNVTQGAGGGDVASGNTEAESHGERAARSDAGNDAVAQAGESASARLPGDADDAIEPAAAIFPTTPNEVLPARMMNEFVYCARLFYYEHVEGMFVESADTMRGAAIHERVDKGSGAMPQSGTGAAPVSAKGDEPTGPAKPKEKTELETIHSRSVMLGSERFGVVAKMDLVDATLDGAGSVVGVCPVDYKAGSPREGADGNELWDTDRMQLGVQCLVLRENGYTCDAGVIYYRGTKQRVRLEYTAELEAWIVAKIAEARAVARGPIPPPLVDSPKCVRCSLAPVCLPDETALLARCSTGLQPVRPADLQSAESETPAAMSAEVGSSLGTTDGRTGCKPVLHPPRRLIAPRDDKRVLFLNTQGYRVGCNDGVLKVKEKDRTVDEVRVSDVSQVAIFGNIQISTQAIQLLCELGVPITFFSMGGWFYGVARGHGLKNVVDRIAQFRTAADPAACLRLARHFVRGKIHNQRVLFMRNHEQPPERVRLRLGKAREDLERATSLEELLGMEGAAAAEYFAEFAVMLRPQEEDEIPGLETNAPEAPWARFDFHGRNRRPPTDPVNALLSLAYSLLAKECTVAAYAVGLDPYVGFFHQPRHGRPALALDMMEEFRPLIAESAVLTAINNRYVMPRDFVTAGRAVNLSPAGRKQFFQCFEQRMNTLVTHPVFDYKVSYRRAVELQFRILARVLTGEVPEYAPFLTR